jgi:hypothetical protein
MLSVAFGKPLIWTNVGQASSPACGVSLREGTNAHPLHRGVGAARPPFPSRAKSLGIEFAEEEKEDLDQLSALHEVLHDAEREHAYLEEEGEDTILQDRIIAKVRDEILVLSKKIR